MKSSHDRKPWSIRLIEHEPVRFILAGSLNTVSTYAAYLALLPLIGYTPPLIAWPTSAES
jgi:hypothetical protein